MEFPADFLSLGRGSVNPSEDPNEHMGRFIRMANTVKLNGVRP